MKTVIISIIGLLIGCSSGACGAEVDKSVKLDMDAVVAIREASEKYGINAQDLIRIAYVESRYNQAAIRVNKNATVDIGMFQVNSVHWSRECRGIDVTKVEGNAMCEAKLLSAHKKHSKTDKNWLGRYHSKTPSKKKLYMELLARAGE